MKTASVAAIKADLNNYVTASEKSPVVITRNGRAVAAIIALEDDEALYRLKLNYSPKFQRLIAESERRIASGGGIPHDEFWKQVHAHTKRNRRSK